MFNHPNFKYLLIDKLSILRYMSEREVGVEQIKQHMLQMQRAERTIVPDQYYDLNIERDFKNIKSMSDLLVKGLGGYSADFLYLRGKNIHVKHGKLNDWQELLTYYPPLILQAAFLSQEEDFDLLDPDDIVRFHNEFIEHNFKYTSLPKPYFPELEVMIKDHQGLHDLHMHLNGTTESSIVWLALLRDTTKALKQAEQWHNSSLAEQFNAEWISDYIELKGQLLSARKIRNYLCEYILQWDKQHPFDELPDVLTSIIADSQRVSTNNDYTEAKHPLSYLFHSYPEAIERALPLEALFCCIVFQYLKRVKDDEHVAQLFHLYLLIMGLINRLLVQQKHQYGFKQFQKLTFSAFRAHSEQEYLARFLQLHGNELKNMSYLEGRFAPREKAADNEELLARINRGWKQFEQQLCDLFPERIQHKARLCLIAHFIKQQDTTKDTFIRHKRLRINLWRQAKILASMIKRKSPLVQRVIGIDAAANEMDAPPEVFAPIFRYLQRNGIYNVTFHAGEDFYHILGGMRAVYEAVDFCELKPGHRIGHGTAMGVSPELWADNLKGKLLIRRGERLNDLIFVYHIILQEKISELNHLIPLLENKIQEENYRIYCEVFSLYEILKAWELRKICPLHLPDEPLYDAALDAPLDADEREFIEKQLYPDYKPKRELARTPKKQKNRFYELFLRYHENKSKEDEEHENSYRYNYDEIIEINAFDILDASAITIIQKSMLQWLNRNGIVIETLPTSNVRIGCHHNFSTYHLWNWYQWKKQGHPIPPIILGTDDAGIFATNIYNEFANIYCHLTSTNKMSIDEAMDLLKKLDDNAHVYKFRPNNKD